MLFLQIKCNINKYNNSIIIQRVEIYLLKINKKRESFIETLDRSRIFKDQFNIDELIRGMYSRVYVHKKEINLGKSETLEEVLIKQDPFPRSVASI